MTNKLKLFSCEKSRYLTEKIAKELGVAIGKSSCTHFSDGEFEVCYNETIRGTYCVIVQSTFPSSDNLMELLMMIDAAKRASAYKIIAVIPYFGFARQDRKSRPRVSITSKLVADMLTVAGVDRIITMDLHADQIQGFFNLPVDHLYASSLFLDYIKELNLQNIAVATPDVGGSKRAKTYSKQLNTNLIICHKTRVKANAIEDMTVIGDVENKDIVLVDDMVDTGGTICKAAKLLKARGASSVSIFATHAVLSGNAYKNLQEAPIERVVFTDSIPLKQNLDKLEVVSTAKLYADVIQSVIESTSISSLFINP